MYWSMKAFGQLREQNMLMHEIPHFQQATGVRSLTYNSTISHESFANIPQESGLIRRTCERAEDIGVMQMSYC